MARVSETMPVTFDAAEKEPIFSGRSAYTELGLELREVDVAVGVLADRDHVGDGLAPRQLVGVVLVRPDEHDRPLAAAGSRPQALAVVEVRRDPQVEDVDQLVDRGRSSPSRRRSPRAGRGRRRRLEDDGAAPPRGSASSGGRSRRLGVGVGVQRQDRVADVVLDERQAAPRRRVVGVGDAADAVRARDRLVVADDRGPDQVDERVRAEPVTGPVARRGVPPVSMSEQPRGWADRPRGRPPVPGRSGDEHLAEVAGPVAVEVDPAADAVHRAARGVLPERPAVAVPVAGGHRGRGPSRPVGDPQDLVAGDGDLRGVADVARPEAGRDVDRRASDAGERRPGPGTPWSRRSSWESVRPPVCSRSRTG